MALDLGRRTGFAYGAPGDAPTSGTVLLADEELPIAHAFGNLISWLNMKIGVVRPSIIVRERPMTLQGFKNTSNGQKTIEAAFGFAAIVQGMAQRHGVCDEAVHYDTVRKHFLGKARMGTRKETKAFTIKRCHLLGYMPQNSVSDDRADACAIFDYAAAHRQPRALPLFGGKAEVA